MRFGIIFLSFLILLFAGCATQNGDGGADLPGPTGLSASSITSNSFTLSWSDVSGVSYYKVFKDGSQYVTNVLSASRSITSLSSGTTYRMTVSYVVNGDESDQSAGLDVSTL